MANVNYRVVTAGLDGYAQLEINRAAFLKNGEVVSQTPLAAAFTAASPCENGMWVDADKANGVIKAPASGTKVFGIVYTTEAEYDDGIVGLKQHKNVAGEYPRVGILHTGDTFTTSCFECADSYTATTLKTACDAAATTPLYVVPQTTSARPLVTTTAPTGAPGNVCYGKVIKASTMPNGEFAIKYNIIVA